MLFVYVLSPLKRGGGNSNGDNTSSLNTKIKKGDNSNNIPKECYEPNTVYKFFFLKVIFYHLSFVFILVLF